METLNYVAEKWSALEFAMLWQTAVLIGIIWALDFLLRKWAWPQVRYALWLLVLVKLVLPPGLTSPASFTAGIPILAEKVVEVQIGRSQTDIAPEQIVTGGEAAVGTVPEPVTQYSQIPAETMPVTAEAVSQRPMEVTAALSLKAYAFLVWAVGIVVLSGWLIVRLTVLRREHFKAEHRANLPERFEKLVTAAARKLKLKKAPRVILTNKVCCPAVFGLFRPVILMPADKLKSLTRQDAEHIILHELAHIKRGDLLVHAIYMTLQIAYWFNPLLWFIRRHLQNIRELCCDATVARILREKTPGYRETLLETARQLLAEPVGAGLGLLGLFENSNRFVDRLRWLEKKTWKNRSLQIVTIFVLVCLMSTCVLPMAATAKDKDTVENERTEKSVQVEEKKVSPVGDYALEFDGVDDYLEIQASKSLQLGRHFTIQMWIKPEFPETNSPDKERNLFCKGGYIGGNPDEKGNRMADAYGFALQLTPRDNNMIELSMVTGNGGNYGSGYWFPCQAGWQHLAIRSDEKSGASKGAIYFSTDPETYRPAPVSNIIIGRDYLIPMGNPFKGQIAELRIWNRELNLDEIALYKTIALTGNEPNLVGCWTFEEGEGRFAQDISPYKNRAWLRSTYSADKSGPTWVRIGAEKENVKKTAVQVERFRKDSDRFDVELAIRKSITNKLHEANIRFEDMILNVLPNLAADCKIFRPKGATRENYSDQIEGEVQIEYVGNGIWEARGTKDLKDIQVDISTPVSMYHAVQVEAEDWKDKWQRWEEQMRQWGEEFGEKYGEQMEQWGQEFGEQWEQWGKQMEEWGRQMQQWQQKRRPSMPVMPQMPVTPQTPMMPPIPQVPVMPPPAAQKPTVQVEGENLSPKPEGSMPQDWVDTARSLLDKPVIERIVNNEGSGKDYFIDFDTGNLFTTPAQMPSGPNPFDTWLKQTSVDAMGSAGGRENIKGLACYDMIVIPVDNQSWDEPSKAAYFVQFLNQGKPGWPVFMTGKGQLPQTYMFKTREGGTGILQITGFSDSPKGTKIRYKLLQEPAVQVEGEGLDREKSTTTKALRIVVYEGNESQPQVTLNIPLAGLKIANTFIPEQAKKQMAAQGIDLGEILKQVDNGLGPTTLLDVKDGNDHVIISTVEVESARLDSEKSKTAKALKIVVYEGDKPQPDVTLNLPLAGLKIANTLIPEQAKKQMAAQGIDLAEILKQVDNGLGPTTLLDVKDGNEHVIISLE